MYLKSLIPFYTATEQVYKLNRFVPIGITASNRKMLCIFNKKQYTFHQANFE
jgi:hypothetical protein